MMQKNHTRIIAAVVVAAGALGLAGCAADPDLGALQSELADIADVNDAHISFQHSGVPWNSSLVASFSVNDSSDAALTDVVLGAVPALATDAVASEYPIVIIFYDGVLADSEEPAQAPGNRLFVDQVTYDALGVEFTGGESVRLTPADVARLFEAS